MTSGVDLSGIMDSIFARISFGVGRRNDEPVDHAVLDHIRRADFAPQRQLYDTAAKQLGTVGAGNHYVDLFEDEDGWVWVGVHFGSRGFGHQTASGFLALAQGLPFEGRAKEGEMDSPPVLFHVDSELGQSYVAAMNLAGEYAYAGRDVVVERCSRSSAPRRRSPSTITTISPGASGTSTPTCGSIRKGCTPAFPGQDGFVGATMGEPSVILRGSDSSASRDLLYSTVHGAGRVMSRTKAAGKLRTRAECSVRDCDFDVSWKERQTAQCPRHPDASFVKRRRIVEPGLIDFAPCRRELKTVRDRAARRRGRRGAGRVQAPGRGAGRAWGYDRDRAPADAARRGDGRRGHLRPVQGLTQRPIDTGWERLREGSWALARDCFAAADSAEAFEGLSWAAWWLDDAETVFSAREHAYRLFLERGEPAAAARMATWIGADQNDFHGATAVASGWFERAAAAARTAARRAGPRLARVPRPAMSSTAPARPRAARARALRGR